MIQKIYNKFSPSENRRRYLNLKGIMSGRYAYKAPDIVQIDLTDKCNSRCLICWIHNPFAMDRESPNSHELNSAVVKNFIKEIAHLGTKEIIFSGGGEPFLYPKVWEILECTQKAGLVFRINTNFTSLNAEEIKKLLSFDKLASITVSVWAGNAESYSALHNRDEDFFDIVSNNLKIFNALKARRLSVKMFTVVHKLNYSCVSHLIKMATETGCDALELGVPDVIPGVTDSFLLNEEQIAFLKQNCTGILNKRNEKDCMVKIANNDLFLKRISNPRASHGEYDSFVDKIPCYAGWVFLRLRANGDFNSCLKSHRIPIGNIYKESFSSVWNNQLQQEFRKKSLSIPRDQNYFKLIGNGSNGEIGCRRICDNFVVNRHLHKFIKYFFVF